MSIEMCAGTVPLYRFTSPFTFGTCGASSYVGPSLNMCLVAYDAPNSQWTQNTSYFAISGNGTQTWTVPVTGAAYQSFLWFCEFDNTEAT